MSSDSPVPGHRFPNGQYRLATAKWPNHYAYMQDGFKGHVTVWSGDAGPQGWVQLINHPTMKGYNLMSTSKWPQCFIFMEWGLIGHCRGWNKCDPGPQGYWKFVPHKDENGQEDGYYMITPQRPGWEDKWFIYVESGFNGSISSWSGDPGPQGWWKVEPWNININQAMDQISATMRELPAMPMLGSVESGYTGPPRRVSQPQALSEIRLEATYSDGMDLSSLHPTQRFVVLHVDQDTVFSQRIGRQHQEAFFQHLLPQRDVLASLSRSIFEMSLEPPSNTPSITKLSQNMVCVGNQHLRKDETMRVSDGTQIRIGASDGQSPILILTVSCTGRRSGPAGIEATCAHLPSASMGGSRGGGYSSYSGAAPAAAPYPAAPAYNGMDTRMNEADNRPGTMPQHLPYNSSGAGGGSGKPQATLECIYSSGCSDLSRAVIPLVADQEVAIGRLHQTGFFEKLLPDHDSLACISRKHLTARLHRGGHMVEIENVSRNTVTIDNQTICQGQKGELREGSTLRFTALERTLLEFRLKSESQASGVPATRFPGF